MGKSTISMAIFHCYVSSPEGTLKMRSLRACDSASFSLSAKWVCLKMWLVPLNVPNGFADHYPVFKRLAIIGNMNPTFSAPNPYNSVLIHQRKIPKFWAAVKSHRAIMSIGRLRQGFHRLVPLSLLFIICSLASTCITCASRSGSSVHF